MALKQFEPKKIYIWVDEFVPLCFTANTASSKVYLKKYGSPTSVTLETSTDGNSWSNYSIGSAITLTNIGDKVYFRNTSSSTTRFSTSGVNYYYFTMTGSISASGDVTSLLNKSGTSTMYDYTFISLFNECTSLTTAPELGTPSSAGVLSYANMFYGCTNLTTLPKLTATTLGQSSYSDMFNGCTKIKLSSTQTGEYQTPYRIPTTGTGSTGYNSLSGMFTSTGGTFTGTPTINTTYYTSNTLV